MTDIIIETENLTRKFGDLTAVDNVSLKVSQGEIFGFLCPNGAGKTTTVRMLTCLISKTSGTAKVANLEVEKSADRKKIRNMIGLLPENVGLYEAMSAYKNLDFYGRFYKLPEAKRKERIEYLLKMLGLWEKRELAAGTFSKGMKQKLAIARALIHDPQVLFLDEPTANLDPEASKIVRDFIIALKKEKKTIFLNTHMLDEADKICDRVGIMKTKLIAVGTPEELRESLFARTTIVQLEKVSEEIIRAVRKLGIDKVEVANNRILISVKDSNKENPDIVHAIDATGGRIQSVSQSNPALEEVYLKLIRS
ncbi:MAG: ATP-binding cassette domain-containing protein [Candidatus Bathyarchaeia archaeon]